MQDQLRTLLRDGFAALNEGRLADATSCCRRVLERQPNLVQGHFLTGLVATEARDRKTAFSAFASVTRLDPKHAAAWAQLARLFMTDGQVARADAALSQAIALSPSDPLVQDLLGTVYSMMGEHGLASDWFERASAQRPNHAPFMLNRANNLIYFGKTEEAIDLLREIIRTQPRSPQAHWSLAGASKATNREHVEQMQALLANESNPRAQAFYAYAIGKELEDLQDWTSAFDAFARGAEARRRTVEFDEAAEIALFERLTQLFSKAWLDRAAPGQASSAPIFVVGQPRTGTTLVERIIGAHSAVHSAGELQQFGLSIRRLTDIDDPRRFSIPMFEAAARIDPVKLGSTYLASCARVRGTTPRFIDKLPQNYLMIPLILAALPGAKIVHLTRDPMDACFASFKQLFADAYLHSYELEEMGRHHARYRKLATCWNDRFGDRIFNVAYEDIVSDLEPNARALLDYLELPWEEACLDFHKQREAVATASAVQVREPVHTRSVGRWKRYVKELEPLRQTLLAEGVL